MKKLILAFIVIFAMQKAYSQDYLYYYLDVYTVNTKTYADEDSKRFISKIFYCKRDAYNIREQTENYKKSFSAYLLEEFSIWDTYWVPNVAAIVANHSFLTKEKAEISIKELTSRGKEEFIHTNFMISDCD